MREILEKFKFGNQILTLIEADILGNLLEKFLSSEVNLSPRPVMDGSGEVKLPGLDNHAMGTIFEELIRRFNEENNEEAGEHFTPRDVVSRLCRLLKFERIPRSSSETSTTISAAARTALSRTSFCHAR